MSPPADDSYWMIRTQDMRIFRPLPKAELIKKIEAGVIAPSDELCAGNGYWFMLSEVNEVREHLGDIDLSCLHLKDQGAHTDTRPIQKTAIIPQKITLENQPSGAAPSPVASQKREARVPVQSAHEAAPATPRIQEVPSPEENPHRTRNAVGVLFVFVAFIVVLVLFWLGSY